MNNMESLRKKTSEELSKQLKLVEEKTGSSIFPKKASLLGTEILQEKYPERYRAFVELLRCIRNPEYKGTSADREIKIFKILNNLDAYLFSAEDGRDKTLIPRQLETFEKIVTFLEHGYREGHVTLPTGIGKTVIFAKFLEAVTKNTQVRALVVGPTKIILHQNKWKLGEFGEIEAGSYYGEDKDLSKQVTVTTYHSLRNGIERGDIKPSEFDVVILDEAHRALGEETTVAVEKFPKDSIKIGFTATPEFHEEKTVGDLLPRTIDEMSVREAIESNLLSGLKVYLIPTKKDLSGLERVGKDYKDELLEREVNTVDRNNLIVRSYKENEIFSGKRAIAYCAGRQHAKDLTIAFKKAGISVAYIDGTLDDMKRGEILRKFHEGEIVVLCNAKVLVEGLDEPEAEVCINAAPTMSKVVAEQRGGRVLRRSKEKNRKVGNILEIIDDFKGSQNTPVLFSEIAGAAEIFPLEEKEVEDGEGIVGPRKPPVRREISEVKVTNDVIDNPDLIMDLTNKNAKQRYEKIFEIAPRGWRYSRELAHELNVKESEIRDFAETQSLTQPDWKKRYLTVTDILMNHYHPILVDLVRKHFNPSLKGTITPQDYASGHAVSETDARRLLEAAEKIGNIVVFHYEDQTYYPEQEALKILKDEDAIQREIERQKVEEAETRFWEDGDRSDEEREREYWENFEKPEEEEEDNSTESDDTNTKGDSETVFYDEDSTRGALWTESEVVSLSNSQKKQLQNALLSLSDRERFAVTRRLLAGETFDSIGKKMGITKTRVQQLMLHGLRLLQHPSRISALPDNIFETEKDAEEVAERAKITNELERLSHIPFNTLREGFKVFSGKLERHEYIGSGEKGAFENFQALLNSLLDSDREIFEREMLSTENPNKLSTNDLRRFNYKPFNPLKILLIISINRSISFC